MANSADLHSPTCQKSILSLLQAPIKSYISLFTVFALPNYLPLLHTQTYHTRRAVAGTVIQNILKNSIKVTQPEHAEGILELVRVLIKEGAQQPTSYPGVPRRGRDVETEDTVEEQGWLARMVHLLYNEDNDIQFKVRLGCLNLRRGVLTLPHSSFRLPQKLLKRVVIALNTHHPLSSQPLLSYPDATNHKNTLLRHGKLCQPHSTVSCCRP